MRVCKHCEGFVPETSKECPNCEVAIEPLNKKGKLSKILYGLIVTGTSMTLMACYGQPPSHCKSKCGEQQRKALLLLYIMNTQNPKKSETNSTTTSSNEKNIKQKRTESGNDVDEIFLEDK